MLRNFPISFQKIEVAFNFSTTDLVDTIFHMGNGIAVSLGDEVHLAKFFTESVTSVCLWN